METHGMRNHRVENLIVIAICVVQYCFLCVVESEQKTFRAEYTYFDETNHEDFVFVGDADINLSALQLTPDTSTNTTSVAFNTGRVLLKQPFIMWDDDGNVASFNTSFLFNIYRVSGVSQGLAFLISKNLILPPNSIGPFLGLTSSGLDGSEDNKLVAVELDSVKDYFDPDDNHVGIDVNSVRSVKTEYLTRHNVNLTAEGVKFYNVWVDYDGLNKVIDVYIAEQANNDDPRPPSLDPRYYQLR